MKKVLIISCLFLIFLVLGAAEKDRLAVMDVQDEAKLFNKTTINNVTDYIFTKLQGTKIYWMIQKADRDTALEQAIEETVKGSRKECVDEKCQLSLVAQLQANFLINTKIKKLYEGICNISISKFDVEKRAGVDSWEEKFNCTEKGLYGAIDSFYFGDSKKEGAAFKTGKMGRLEDDWTPDMAGTGERVIVYFESDPVGATISVDGKVEGVTPDVKSRLLSSGKHQIKMEKEGFYTESKIVDVKKGDKISFKLLSGITINSNPQGAMVKIDGKLTCQTTPCQRVVDEGQREIVTQKELYATKTQMINVQRGKDIKIDLDPDYGWIEIKSPYDGVDVFLDGKNIGKTPIHKMQVSRGEHIIEPKGGCFNTASEGIIVEKLKVKSVNLTVQQKSAAIEVYSKDDKDNDIEADVYVDGKNVGTSPGTFPISFCSKEVVVKYQKNEFKQTLKLQEKKILPVYVFFKSQTVSQPKYGGSSLSGQNKYLAVMDVEDESGLFNKKTLSNLTDYIFDKFLKTDIYYMVPKADKDTPLMESGSTNKKIVEGPSRITLTKQLQANFLIVTKIKKLSGETCNIIINKFDIEMRATVQAWVDTFNCSEKGLFKTIDKLNFKSFWSKKVPKGMTWEDANEYCENLKEDGFSDWRLPTISELRTLVKNCPAIETDGDCKVTNECLHFGNCRNDACVGCSDASDGRYSKLGDTGCFWSSSEQSDNTEHSWVVNFRYVRVGNGYKNREYDVRCIR